MLAERLKKNDYIGLAAPSWPITREDYVPVLSSIEKLGYKVKTGNNIYKCTYGYCASEQERASDIMQLVMDSEVKLVFFGGGEGANELLPYIDFKKIQEQPKLFLSYSDGTTLLDAIYMQTGLVTYYGQTPGIFPDIQKYDYEQFIANIVTGRVNKHISNSKWYTLNAGVYEGVLLGGYLENFILLMNTRYFKYDSDQKYILFIEDHEKFSGIQKVSALMSWLEQIKFIKNVSGVLFGNYSDAISQNFLDMLKRFGNRNNITIAYCDDFGHGVNHAIFPIGYNAVLDTSEQTLIYNAIV
jgi:muramoyltetrapeptide carboxypeptidase